MDNGGIELNDCGNYDIQSKNLLVNSDESDGDSDKLSQGSHDSFKCSSKIKGCDNEFIESEETSKLNLPVDISRIESIEKNEDENVPEASINNIKKDESCKQIPSTIEGWASKELKTFLENMKEDTNKPLTRFVVHKLLWMYIKKHKLQNPRKMSDIICDKQLQIIFEKDSVGQFEMFKLLNKHFPTKAISKGSQNTTITSDKQKLEETSTQDVINQEKSKYDGLKIKRKNRKMDEVFQRPNSDEYAAINYKNISLIYLRRSILEEFIVDPNFESKVIGTFVKIRVPGNSKVDSCYRLVLVTGNYEFEFLFYNAIEKYPIF